MTNISRGADVMDKNRKGKFLVKSTAVLMLFFVILYAAIGVISAKQKISGLGPAFDSNNPFVMLIAYGTVYFAFICAFVGLEVSNETLPPALCRIMGMLVILLSLIALVYIRIKEHRLEFFNIASALCGMVYLYAPKYFDKKSAVS